MEEAKSEGKSHEAQEKAAKTTCRACVDRQIVENDVETTAKAYFDECTDRRLAKMEDSSKLSTLGMWNMPVAGTPQGSEGEPPESWTAPVANPTMIGQ